MDPVEIGKEESLTEEHKVTPINRSRAKRTKAYRKLEKKQIRTRNIAALIFLVLICGITLSVASLKHFSSENRTLESDLNQANLQIEALVTDTQSLRLENDNLVQGRIPGLIPIKFDDPHKIENQMLKSVVFTKTKHNGQTRYEYLAVVANNTEDVIRPASLLIFFNKLGVEVGKGRIAIALDFDNQVKMIALQPGESHSFTGAIDLISDDEPKYFKLIEQ